MQRELAGVPLWIWGIGAAVVLGGYLWIRHQQQSTPAGSPAPAGTSTGRSTLHETITDFQGGGTTPTPTKTKHHKKQQGG